MIEFKTLTVSAMRGFGEDLLEAHYQELTLHKEVVKLNVDWEKYSLMEKRGMLMSIGVFEDSILVGYSVFILADHAHYKDMLVASNDVLFLREDKRKGSLGVRLVRESEARLHAKGVTKILWHCKYGTVLGKLLKHMGYVNEEFTMGKILGS
jgi:hypothetical protein